MKLVESLRSWWQVQTGDVTTPFDGDSAAFLGSFLVHLAILLALGFAPIVIDQEKPQVGDYRSGAGTNRSNRSRRLPKSLPSRPAARRTSEPTAKAGTHTAMSSAEVLDPISDVPHPAEIPVIATGDIVVNNEIAVATGSRLENIAVRGARWRRNNGGSRSDRSHHQGHPAVPGRTQNAGRLVLRSIGQPDAAA